MDLILNIIMVYSRTSSEADGANSFTMTKNLTTYENPYPIGGYYTIHHFLFTQVHSQLPKL